MTSYRYQSQIFGSFGIGIDAVVNSAEAKAMVSAQWKARLAYERREVQRDREADGEYLVHLERHLGKSLRWYQARGNWVPILGWFRRHAKSIMFWIAQAYFWAIIIRRVVGS